MKKKLVLCVLLVGLLTGCGKIPQLSNGQNAVVEFNNGDMISVDEIWNEFKNSYGLDILLKKIDSKIYNEEFKDKQSEADEYVKNYETYLKSSYVDDKGNYDEETLLNTLKQYGYSSLQAFLDVQKQSFYEDLAITEYAKTLIKESEIKKYYNDEIVGDISCLHVLVKPASDSTDDQNKAKEKAEKIIKDINDQNEKGTSYEDAIKKYENDESVTFEDLGYFNKGSMEEPFEKAAYSMKKGTISKEAVKTSYGYHVIYKADEKEKDSLENKTDSIKETLAKDLIEKDSTIQVQALLELRKKYGVKFDDSEMEDSYNKYINYLINQNKNTDK